eukprot:TRINITY_DN6501_c0_g4_i1.p1 TRINITY_DN6501_c0_g4~~TRINITY_DN6501_c0_g4_i1.p1  ORF type:complete len:184 (-),score=36.64 TRINITY_DN6501_c0_g4_i1:130-681(-)
MLKEGSLFKRENGSLEISQYLVKVQMPLAILDEVNSIQRKFNKQRKKERKALEEELKEKLESQIEQHKEQIRVYEKELKKLIRIIRSKNLVSMPEDKETKNKLELALLYKEKYYKKCKDNKVIPDKLLVIGNKTEYCPSCGSFSRQVIKRFATCDKNCKFNAKCTRCLYATKLQSSGKFIGDL